MDMKERLHELVIKAWHFPKSELAQGGATKYLIQHNVVALPCKPGDTIYHVFPKKGITERKVKRIVFKENGFVIAEQDNIFHADEIGKTIFFTREEAEVAWEKIKPFTLKPCPFCGGEAHIVETEHTDACCRMKIACKGCDVTLEHDQLFYVHERRDITGAVIEVVRESVNGSAIDMWNRRADNGDSV